MRTVESPIGCIAFLVDNHKVVIINVQKGSENIEGRLIGRCIHGDTFEPPLDYPLYEQVEYKES